MAYSPVQLRKLSDTVGDTLFHLIEDLRAAEIALSEGRDVEKNLTYISETGAFIRELEITFDILHHAQTHGPRPCPDTALAQALPHAAEEIEQAVANLSARGIVHGYPDADKSTALATFNRGPY